MHWPINVRGIGMDRFQTESFWCHGFPHSLFPLMFLFQCFLNLWQPMSLNAAAKSLQSCPTLCDPIDGSPPSPTRLPRPWDSPGKNTGVGCHFLLQCMKAKSESEVTQSCPTPATPWTATHQASPFMGFSRQEYWSGVPLPSPMSLNKDYIQQNPQSTCDRHSEGRIQVFVNLDHWNF